MAVDPRLAPRVQADSTEVPFKCWAFDVYECETVDWRDRHGIVHRNTRMWKMLCACGREMYEPAAEIKGAMKMDCGCRASETMTVKPMGHRGPGRPRKEKTWGQVAEKEKQKKEREERVRDFLGPRRPAIRMGRGDGQAKKQTSFMFSFELREQMALAAYEEGMTVTAWIEMLVRERLDYLKTLNGAVQEELKNE